MPDLIGRSAANRTFAKIVITCFGGNLQKPERVNFEFTTAGIPFFAEGPRQCKSSKNGSQYLLTANNRN